jgi:hypothetical protein
VNRALKILLFLTVASIAAMAAPHHGPSRWNPPPPPPPPPPSCVAPVSVPEPMNLLMAGAGALVGLSLLRKKFTA